MNARILSGGASAVALVAGIGIGSLAGGGQGPAVAVDTVRDTRGAREASPAPQDPQRTGMQGPRIDGMPASMQPWRDPDDPNIMRLDDELKELLDHPAKSPFFQQS